MKVIGIDCAIYNTGQQEFSSEITTICLEYFTFVFSCVISDFHDKT